jgi:hypothetical protein
LAQTASLLPVFLPDVGRGGLVVDGEFIADLLDEFDFEDDEPSDEDLAAIEEEGDEWD